MALADTKPGNVVREFMIGDTRVKICDDYCRDKTPEDVDRILKRIAALVLPELQAAAAAREKANPPQLGGREPAV